MSPIAEEHLAVVVLDDDVIFRDLICATVESKSKFVMFGAASVDELLNVVKNQKIDCVLLDYNLDGDTGFSAKQRLDQASSNPPPSIMMTGDGRESTAIKAFRMGVADYLPKRGLSAESIVKTVVNVVERDRQDKRDKLQYSKLVEASNVDLITGLESRPQLDERLAHLAALSSVSRRAYALILIDIVDMQLHTERLGLKTIDQILRTLGKQLQGLVRSNDICGRYAAGTFLVIASVCDGRSGFDTLCERLASEMPRRFNLASADLDVSVQIVGGFCQAESSRQLSGSDLIQPLIETLARARSSGSVMTVLDGARCDLANPTIGREISAAKRSFVECDAVEAPPAADALRSTDRRKAVRQRVFKRGLIHVIGSQSTFNCVVRNISTLGAGLRLETPSAVPEVFELEVVGTGRKRAVKVRWQIAADLGVEFQSS